MKSVVIYSNGFVIQYEEDAMNTETKTTIQLGDAMLYVSDHYALPVACHVTKINKKTFKVSADGKEFGLFKLEERYWKRGETVWHEPLSQERYSRRSPRIYGIEAKDELIKAYEEDQQRRKEKEEERKAKIAKREAEEAEELRAVKLAMGGDPEGDQMPLFRMVDTMADGSRLYVVTMPVQEQYHDRKGIEEKVIIRCKDVEDDDWDHYRKTEEERKITRVEMGYTYCNSITNSFASVSTSKYDTESEAVWDALRREYHSW